MKKIILSLSFLLVATASINSAVAQPASMMQKQVKQQPKTDMPWQNSGKQAVTKNNNMPWQNSANPNNSQQAQGQKQNNANCQNNILGTVAGGAMGGLLGNQFGKGKGKTAATVLGVVGGAAAGNQMMPLGGTICP